MKRIFVACGSGVATSQTVASKIQSMCEDEGLDVSVEAVDIKSLESIIDQCDIYVSIVSDNADEWDVPTIKGIPFLTGVGMDEEFEKLKELIEERKKAREEKNWQLSDLLRDQIKEKGYIVKDTKEGMTIDKI